MGKIELDHTGSGSGITLSSDGTDLLLNGTAVGGGGGADLYAANESSPTAQPSATGANAVAIGDQAIASGDDSLAFGEHSDATAARSFSFGFGATATHTGALALGTSRAFAVDAVAIGIDNNSTSYGASGSNSVAIGDRAKATANYAISIGYNNAVSSYSGFGAGYGNIVTGDWGVAIGQACTAGTTVSGRPNVAIGYSSKASGGSAFAFGERSDTRGLYGKYAFSSGYGAGTGTTQTGVMVLDADTTDATATALCTNQTTTTADSTNQIILPNNSAFAFHGTIVARQQASGGTASAAWKIEGLIRREGTAATTTLVNSATTVLDNTPSWGMALSADTTNGGLKIEVTGAAATNIRWVATIHTSEVTYA